MNDAGLWFIVAVNLLLLAIAALVAWQIVSILLQAWSSSPAAPPSELKDPLFGRITSPDGSNTWTCERHFQPAHSVIPVLVQADGGGPTDDQRSLFREIENRFPEFEREVRRRLAELSAEWNPDAKSDFKIAGLNLEGGAEARWTIDFALPKAVDDLVYCVSFAEWQIEDAFVET